MVIKFLSFFKNKEEEELLYRLQEDKRHQKQSLRVRKSIEQILDVFPEPTLIVRNDGTVSYYNKAFLRTFSISSDVNVSHLSDVFREPQILSLAQESMEKGSVKKEVQVFLPGSDTKKYFTIFKTLFVTKNEDGSHDQLIVFHDITSVKKADLMKTDFISNVSHELRTPLMSIQGYVKTLKEDIHSKNFDQVDQFFQVIESHVERLTLLVNDLLELSYLESEAELEKKRILPKEITQKVLERCLLDLKTGQYEVETTFEIDYLMADDRLIEQVLINLIQNAIRYTPPKTKISILWTLENNKPTLIFKDNGPGVSEDYLTRIFERFYRIDPHRSRDKGGTGLGLSIVKHIMQRHGGTVHAKSKLGYGLEFHCTFPNQ